MLSWIGVHWCSLVFIGAHWTSTTTSVFPNVLDLPKKESLYDFKKISMDIHTGSSRPCHQTATDLRKGEDFRYLYALRQLLEGFGWCTWEADWKNAGRGVWKWNLPTTIVGMPWKPNQKHHHCEPCILDDLCYPQTKIDWIFWLATWAFRHCYNWCENRLFEMPEEYPLNNQPKCLSLLGVPTANHRQISWSMAVNSWWRYENHDNLTIAREWKERFTRQMGLLKTLMAENSSMLCTWNDLNLDWIHIDQTSFPPFPTNLQFKPAFSQSCRIAVSNEELLTPCFQGIFQIFHTLHPEATSNSSSLRKAANSRFAKPKLLDHMQMYNWQTCTFEQYQQKKISENP